MIRRLPLLLALAGAALGALGCDGDGADLPPIANAGGDRAVEVGQEVGLDGSASADPDGDALSYAWSFLERPAGSAAELAGSDAATSSFTPDLVGRYEVELTVAAGDAEDTDTVVVTATTPGDSRAPTARAGADRSVQVGSSVTLDGGASTDPDGDALTFAWSFAERPDGSAAALATPDTARATFAPDLEGAYRIVLAVSDGVATDEDELVVTAVPEGDAPPVADAGADRTVDAGSEVLLDGSGSSDPDGDALAYAWTFVTWPNRESEPAPALDGADTAAPRFVAPEAGWYTLELAVEAGGLEDFDQVTVTARAVDPVSVVYADPRGDDAAPGTAEAPVRTVGRALEVAAALELGKIELAAGSFDAEPFAYAITRSVSIRGQGADATRLEAGDADLFDLDADGSVAPVDLTLQHLTLRTGGRGLSLPSGTRAFLTAVRCEDADPCVRAADLLGFLPAPGGVLTLRDSVLQGAGSGAGITVAGGAHLIAGSVIRGFGRGIYGFGAALRIRDSEFSDNGVGVRADGSIDVDNDGEVDRIRIQGGAWSGNGIGLHARGAVLDVQELALTDSERYGLRLESVGSDGEAVLVDVTVTGSGASGVRLDGGALEIYGGALDGNGTIAQDDFVDRAGLHASGASEVMAEGTAFRANAQDDVVLLGDTTAVLRGIEASNVPGLGAGVYANTSGEVRVVDSLLAGNNNGLFVSGATPLALRGVTARDNRYSGLSYRASGTLLVRGSQFLDNERFAVQVRGSPGALDFGGSGVAEGNLLALSGAANAWGLSDERPDRSTQDGVVLTAQALTFRSPTGSAFDPAGAKVGPADSGATQYWRITGENQRVDF